MTSLPDPARASAWPAAWRKCCPELKKIARARLHAAGTQPRALAGLNTTALVNESCPRLADRVVQIDFPSQGHFYA